MPPLSAFLITRDTEHSAIQGEENSVFLLYSVANFVFSSGGPQPRLDVSQQFGSGLVLPHVEVSRLLQKDGISQKSRRKTRAAKAFDTAWKGRAVLIL